jgi:predicted DNA-binding protein (UPF0251 family)
MVCIVPTVTGYGGIVRVPVSLAYVAALIDGTKYLEPADVKPPEDATERRRYLHRGPSFRFLVREAVARETILDADARMRRQQRARALVAYGMRQVDVAEALGVSKQTVTNDLAAARSNVTAR